MEMEVEAGGGGGGSTSPTGDSSCGGVEGWGAAGGDGGVGEAGEALSGGERVREAETVPAVAQPKAAELPAFPVREDIRDDILRAAS